MAASSSSQVLVLYRTMLKESKKFSAYNYRTFALRRIRDAFRENKNETNAEVIQELIEKAKTNTEIIRRQILSLTEQLHQTIEGPNGMKEQTRAPEGNPQGECASST